MEIKWKNHQNNEKVCSKEKCVIVSLISMPSRLPFSN